MTLGLQRGRTAICTTNHRVEGSTIVADGSWHAIAYSLSVSDGSRRCFTAYADIAGKMRQELSFCGTDFGDSPLNMLGISFPSAESVPPDAVDEVQIFAEALNLEQLQEIRDTYRKVVPPNPEAARLPLYDLGCSPLSTPSCKGGIDQNTYTATDGTRVSTMVLSDSSSSLSQTGLRYVFDGSFAKKSRTCELGKIDRCFWKAQANAVRMLIEFPEERPIASVHIRPHTTSVLTSDYILEIDEFPNFDRDASLNELITSNEGEPRLAVDENKPNYVFFQKDKRCNDPSNANWASLMGLDTFDSKSIYGLEYVISASSAVAAPSFCAEKCDHYPSCKFFSAVVVSSTQIRCELAQRCSATEDISGQDIHSIEGGFVVVPAVNTKTKAHLHGGAFQ